jgi:hypothetical protein
VATHTATCSESAFPLHKLGDYRNMSFFSPFLLFLCLLRAFLWTNVKICVQGWSGINHILRKYELHNSISWESEKGCVSKLTLRQDMYLVFLCIVPVLTLIPDIVISLVGWKINCLRFVFTYANRKIVFFIHWYSQISCNVLKTFLVGSALWDNTQYLSHFPKTIHVYYLRKVRQHMDWYFWVFQFWDNKNKHMIPSYLVWFSELCIWIWCSATAN